VNLVFYSGGYEIDNIHLDQEMIKLTGKAKPSITYIPSCSFDSEIEFNDFVKHYRKLGLSRFIHFPVDLDFDETIMNEAFDSDIIHLSGGNTYYFLKYLRKNKILSKLKAFVKRGGVLTGLSAGAIIMTPNIDTAGFPEFDKDDNEEGIKNFRSMGLVDFEFFPHYKNSKRYDQELLAHSKRSQRKVIACADGSGLVIKDHEVHIHGRCFQFHCGRKEKVNLFD
jgi:dipeptidase E